MLTPTPPDLQSCAWVASFGPHQWSERWVCLENWRQLHSGWAPSALVAAAKRLADEYPLRGPLWIRMGPRWGLRCDLDPSAGPPWPHLTRFLRDHHGAPPRKLQEAASLALADVPVTWSFRLNWGREYVSRPWLGHPHRHRARLSVRLPRQRLGRFLWHFCPTYGNPNVWVELGLDYNEQLRGAETVDLQLVPAEPLAITWQQVALRDLPLQPGSCPHWQGAAVSLCWENMPSSWSPPRPAAPICPYLSRLTHAGWKVSFPWSPL